jgi:hypothetical protein
MIPALSTFSLRVPPSARFFFSGVLRSGFLFRVPRSAFRV